MCWSFLLFQFLAHPCRFRLASSLLLSSPRTAVMFLLPFRSLRLLPTPFASDAFGACHPNPFKNVSTAAIPLFFLLRKPKAVLSIIYRPPTTISLDLIYNFSNAENYTETIHWYADKKKHGTISSSMRTLFNAGRQQQIK